MSIRQILTNELVFRWDTVRKRLHVLDATRGERSIAVVDVETLREMPYPDASRFIGEFVTLLVPELRSMYEPDFGNGSSQGGNGQ